MGDHASYAPRSPDLSGVGIPVQNHSDMWGSPSQSYSLKNPKQEPSDFMHAPETYPAQVQTVQSSWFGPTQMSSNHAPQMHNPYGHEQQQHQQQHQYHHQQQQQQQQPHHAAQAPNLKVEAKQEPEVYKPYPGELEGTQIKTKFPVARIKRIVQADEDVGKVAQVTPVVVSKALELFMTSLALNAANVAKSRGSKRVTGAHLKLAVAQDDQFDFLQDIVDKIPDPPPASSAANRGGADDGEKKPRAKARKKKDSSEDDDEDDDHDDMAFGEHDQQIKQKRKPRAPRKKKADDSD